MFSTVLRRSSKYTLPDLPYAYNALEPFISAEIMEVHHKKHHQAYINNLIIAESQLHEAKELNDLTAQIALQPSLKFNGGGHINHSIFWQNLAPTSKGNWIEGPKGPLLNAINKDFGSFDAFKTKFSAQAAGVQGSGWAWLAMNYQTKRLEIIALPNQDPLTSHAPLLGIDIWEHAYYLQYKNVRPDYLKAIWNIVNWDDVSRRATLAGVI